MRVATLLLSLLAKVSLELSFSNVRFAVISQNNDYNNKLANQLEKSLREQCHQSYVNASCSCKHFINIVNTLTDWTPIMNIIESDTENNVQWLVFLEDRTHVALKTLMSMLEKYDSNEEIWIGHALHDSDATIIHHFAFYEDPTFFKYPNLGSGMALSVPLLKKLKSLIERGFQQLDFHIDPAHEFALFVYDEGNGSMIQHDPAFCCKKGPNCATYPKEIERCDNADASSIFFAIKTYQKFHNNRLKVVKNTWHKYVEKSTFFSDIEDPEIPTESLGVPNTEQGHCEKTMEILRYALKRFNNDSELKWLALVDDDTILSVSRMANLLACHQRASQPLILGERYRFRAQGFNYPTGGAGILINKAALHVLAQACKCPRLDSPDDMVLGACAKEFGVNLVHVPQMHQARPTDYAPGRLANGDAISFHKHWTIDPIEVYEQWFLNDDQDFVKNSEMKSEL